MTRTLLGFIASLLLLSGCAAGPAAAPEAPRPKLADGVFLVYQGIAPADDGIGFNEKLRKMGEGYSAELAAALQKRGLNFATMVNQSTKLDLEGKIAMAASRYGTDKIVTVEIKMEEKPSGREMSLQLHFFALEFQGKDSATIRKNVPKNLMLITPTQDHPPTEQLAESYAQFLLEQGLVVAKP